MRKPQEQVIKRSVPLSRSHLVPAPTGGLNFVDPPNRLKPNEALVLDNFFPDTSGVRPRGGTSTYATFTGEGLTLFGYAGISGEKLFVAVKNGSDYRIIDATSGGAISTAVVGGSGPTVTALTSALFDFVQVTTTGGTFMVCCNDYDSMLEYEYGAGWSVSGITGPTHANVKSLAVYGERVWMMMSGSFTVWYLPTGAKSGAATSLNLGMYFKQGGQMSVILTCNVNSGAGLQELICFISDKGECLVYQGDPATAASWTRVAVLMIPAPVCSGIRAWCRFGYDALLYTNRGVYSMSALIRGGGVTDESMALSSKINPILESTSGNYHQLFMPSFGGKLYVNQYYPWGVGYAGQQWVMNIDTGAWCRYTGWYASMFAQHFSSIYFSNTDGKIVKCEIAETKDGHNSDRIYCVARLGMLNFGAPTLNKLLTFARLHARGQPYKIYLTTVNDFWVDSAMIDYYNGVFTFTGVVPTEYYENEITSPVITDNENLVIPVDINDIGQQCSIVHVAEMDTGDWYEWYSVDIVYQVGGPLGTVGNSNVR